MHIPSNYRSQFPINNGHLETIVPYYLRRSAPVGFTRERINTSDGDFLDLDWLRHQNPSLVVLSHGLEGCTGSHYIHGMTRELTRHGFDILAWNNRGCSGETNRKLQTYHSGASHDLRDVLNHVFNHYGYQSIYLVGFSMGGNITLKYLGEEADRVNPRIKKAVAISTPVSLADAADALSKGFSRVYSKSFILRLVRKMKLKSLVRDDYNPNLRELRALWDFESFDNRVTAPLNGFKDARDYWQKASSLFFLPSIRVKSLIINAQNDPFLAKRCYPYAETRDHPFVDLEVPVRGGHVGFLSKGLDEVWIEPRVAEYLLS